MLFHVICKVNVVFLNSLMIKSWISKFHKFFLKNSRWRITVVLFCFTLLTTIILLLLILASDIKHAFDKIKCQLLTLWYNISRLRRIFDISCCSFLSWLLHVCHINRLLLSLMIGNLKSCWSNLYITRLCRWRWLFSRWWWMKLNLRFLYYNFLTWWNVSNGRNFDRLRRHNERLRLMLRLMLGSSYLGFDQRRIGANKILRIRV